MGKEILIAGSLDGTIKLFRCREDAIEELIVLAYSSPLLQLNLSSDGRKLALLLKNERGIRVWHLDRLEESLQRMGLGMELPEFPVPAVCPVKSEKKGGFQREIFTLDALSWALESGIAMPGEDGEVLDPGMPLNQMHRWSGWLRSPCVRKHLLKIQSPDGLRVWWNGRSLVDRWKAGQVEEVLELEMRPYAQPLRIEVKGRNLRSGLRVFWRAEGDPDWRPLTEADVVPSPTAFADP